MKSIFSDEQKKITEKLKAARIKQGYSQEQLAEKLGNTQSYISKVEQGQIRLDIVQLKKISEALGEDYRKLI